MKNSADTAVAFPAAAKLGRTHRTLVAAAFLIGFVSTSCLLHPRQPLPSAPELASHFRYFAEHKDEFDAIFIGSSHVRHGIVPEEFDEETKKQHAPTHSFNLGFTGMWPPESCYYLRLALALHPQKLRWVFIELMDFRGQAEGEVPTARSLYWHDLQHTEMTWRLAAELPLSFPQKVEFFKTHTWQFVLNMTNPGRGAEWVERHYLPMTNLDTSWISRRGFDPLPAGGWAPGAKTRYLQQIETFQFERQKIPMRPGLASALEKLARDVKEAGAKPIFIILPTVRPEEHFDAATISLVDPVLAFDDPKKFPRLYLPELHFDAGHLNEAGSQEFSALVAEEFAKAITPSSY